MGDSKSEGEGGNESQKLEKNAKLIEIGKKEFAIDALDRNSLNLRAPISPNSRAGRIPCLPQGIR